VDKIPSVKTESDLQGELDRLKSRLAQGQRDHQRSHDELRRLDGEIRQIESELRTLNREHDHGVR
jgi:chromosome segregation ATPase